MKYRFDFRDIFLVRRSLDFHPLARWGLKRFLTPPQRKSFPLRTFPFGPGLASGRSVFAAFEDTGSRRVFHTKLSTGYALNSANSFRSTGMSLSWRLFASELAGFGRTGHVRRHQAVLAHFA